MAAMSTSSSAMPFSPFSRGRIARPTPWPARAVLETLAAQDGQPRGIGIGLHDCRVIAGAVGPPERQDFTVIGDGVNVAARMSTVAHTLETVTDFGTFSPAGRPEGFTAPEGLEVKGRSEALRVRRWRPESVAV